MTWIQEFTLVYGLLQVELSRPWPLIEDHSGHKMLYFQKGDEKTRKAMCSGLLGLYLEKSIQGEHIKMGVGCVIPITEITRCIYPCPAPQVSVWGPAASAHPLLQTMLKTHWHTFRTIFFSVYFLSCVCAHAIILQQKSRMS